MSRSFSIFQGTGKGRILAPFMYNEYINSLMNELTEQNFAICISGIKLSALSSPDDAFLLVLYPTFLSAFHEYCLRVQLEIEV